MTLWLSTQAPHLERSSVVDVLGFPENKLRVIAIDVGGGFGCKIDTYPETILAAQAMLVVTHTVLVVQSVEVELVVIRRLLLVPQIAVVGATSSPAAATAAATSTTTRSSRASSQATAPLPEVGSPTAIAQPALARTGMASRASSSIGPGTMPNPMVTTSATPTARTAAGWARP